METRRVTRQSLKAKVGVQVPVSQAIKRKMSTTQTEQKKRNALGDISNKENSGQQIQGTSAKTRKLNKPASSKQTNSISNVLTENHKNILSSRNKPTVVIEKLEQRITPEGRETDKDYRLSPRGASTLPVTQNSASLTLKWNDIDKENENDVFSSPEYASDIFDYYRMKEDQFLVDDYMARQAEVVPSMRAVLVDWMVEVQENFELNHETLYLAVRLVDHYLMKKVVSKEGLQLIGAAAIFIGCKFDERIPPLVDDFLYICDDAYDRQEFVKAEKDILKTVSFNLGMPISYRFLRRFAKASKQTMKTLTLARYIGETALTSYKIVKYRESLVAAGCLKLALMWEESTAPWDDTLIYYTGYTEHDLMEICLLLNNTLHHKPANLHTIDHKYSHPVFHEVSKLPKLSLDLYPNNRCSKTCSLCGPLKSVFI